MDQDLVTSPLLDPHPTERCRVRLPVIEAASKDHAAIYCFLHSVSQAPSREEFNSSLEDPFYEPCDRLLLRRPPQIISHVHLTHRAMLFGSLTIPAAGLADFVVAPEHRNQGLGRHLLRAAECRVESGGALLGMLHTAVPHFFRRSGWALCGGASYRRADARALLARLLDHGAIPRPRRRLHIRPLLQWEHDALARIYQQNMRPQSDIAVYGPFERTPAYWRWLLNRHAYDEIFVALEGPEQLELGEISTHIVGYAVTRGEQIVELMASSDCPRAEFELLARCCGDAIERDRHCVVLHAPPDCPLFALFDEAGASGPPHLPERGKCR